MANFWLKYYKIKNHLLENIYSHSRQRLQSFRPIRFLSFSFCQKCHNLSNIFILKIPLSTV